MGSGGLLDNVSLSYLDADTELRSFKTWLDQNREFGETDVTNELHARRNLCLLIQHAVAKGVPDRIRWEVAMLGVFRADLVIGSTVAREFVLIEFEDGKSESLFKRRRDGAQLHEWATRTEHAFSQASDWAWAKGQHGNLYQNVFGMPNTVETYLIICGRDEFLSDPISRERLYWRSQKTYVEARKVVFWTYDDLYENALAEIVPYRDMYRQALANAASAQGMN